MTESLNDAVFFWTVLLVGLGIVIKNWYDRLDMQQILHTALMLLYGLAVLFVIIFLVYLALRYGQKNKERINDFKTRITSYQREHASLTELVAVNQELNNYLRWRPFLARHYTALIKKTKKHLDKQKQKLQEQMRETEARRIIAQHAAQAREEQIEKLLVYFKKMNSCKSIPFWATTYSQSMINTAVSWYEQEEHEKWETQKKEEDRQEDKMRARRFVRKHHGLPVNFASRDEEERADLLEALQLQKEHKLTIDEPIADDETDDERTFYHANKLNPQRREELLRKHGFRHKAFITLDGKRGNNLIIKNDTRKESDYHFCLKHLFAELEPEQSEIEYRVGDKWADVLFHLPQNKLLAVEIETGTNKELATRKKVEWLNDAFDYWIITCSRHNKHFYKSFVDNKKSYCLTVKRAAEKITELLAGHARKEIIKPAVAQAKKRPFPS